MNEEPISVEQDALEFDLGQLLARAGAQLAVAETGTAGEVAGFLQATPEGAAVLTKAHVLSSPAELAAQLGLSPAKLGAFGWLSPMVAAEAAAALIDTYEGGWGLAVLSPYGNPQQQSGVTGEEAFVALGTPSTMVIESCPPAGVTRVALHLLHREATQRLK